MTTVIIIDDHPLVRRGIANSIQEIPGFNIVGEAGDADGAFDLLSRGGVDITILDISLPGEDGMEVLKKIQKKYPNVKILMLTMHPEELFALRAFRMGASGYLAKAQAPQELAKALIKISDGGKYISESMSTELIDHLDSNIERHRFELLSDRELQVLILIAGGDSTNTIANQLSLSAKTVSTYRTRLLQKMQMHSTAELIRYALDNHLIE